MTLCDPLGGPRATVENPWSKSYPGLRPAALIASSYFLLILLQHQSSTFFFRYVVNFSVYFTLFGVCVVLLLIASGNIQSLLQQVSPAVFDILLNFACTVALGRTSLQ